MMYRCLLGESSTALKISRYASPSRDHRRVSQSSNRMHPAIYVSAGTNYLAECNVRVENLINSPIRARGANSIARRRPDGKSAISFRVAPRHYSHRCVSLFSVNALEIIAANFSPAAISVLADYAVDYAVTLTYC